ncbi:MAG: NADH-quinone oxidoreductase subunit C, partial [Phycisphaerae bacterium]
MSEGRTIIDDVKARMGPGVLAVQATADGIPTLWSTREKAHDVLRFLKTETQSPYRMLYDLTGIDERTRRRRDGQPRADFTVVYHLLSPDRNSDIRVKVPLLGDSPSLPTVTDLWPSANWYEREAWDMFGVAFDGHPNLRRIIMPRSWKGHPLRKDHPARATEMEPFSLPRHRQEEEEKLSQFRPEEWGLARYGEDTDFMFLNIGPHHPSTHGVLRVVLQLDGEEIIDVVPDIGYHHRGAEKMGERQSWHTYIPYT